LTALTGLPARVRNWAGAAVKRAGEQAGLEIRRYRPPALRRTELLLAHRIELVIDVGANRGQYAQELRAHGYRHEIVSFEPAAEAFETLRQRSAADHRWSIRQLAVSDEEAIVELGAADNFSSLLPVAGRLSALFPEAAPHRRERVHACRLDATGLELPEGSRTLLKLDVQGFERQAIAGAGGILEGVAIIETELSVAPLYVGQALLAEIVCLLERHDYRLVELDPVLRDRTTGQYLQFDGLFVKR